LERADKKSKLPRYALLFIKVAVSSALLIYLFSKVGGMEVIRNFVMISPAGFVAAALLYILASYISSRRWRLFLPPGLGMRWIFSTYMIGAFFNVCLPSTIGGDAVKIFYMNKKLSEGAEPDRHGNRPSHAAMSVASVFMDRYIGLAALLCLGMAATLAGHDMLEKSPVLWLTPAIFLAFIIGSILFFRFRIGTRLRFVMNMYDYAAPYFRQKDIIVKGLLFSVVIQTVVVFSVYVLARGMGIDLPFLTFLLFVPLVSMISLIPVSISGFGLREGSYVVLLGLVGVRPDLAMTLSIVHFLSVAVASLLGLIEYLRFKQLFGGGMKEETLKP
jgi:uncharacterized protein (TIRG00374 family)